jgi:hypothetical protein
LSYKYKPSRAQSRQSQKEAQMDKHIKAAATRIAERLLNEKKQDDADFINVRTTYDLADEFHTDTGINVSIDDLEDIFLEIVKDHYLGM